MHGEAIKKNKKNKNEKKKGHFYFSLYSLHFHNDPHYLNHILNFTKINLLKLGNLFFHLQCQPRISRSGYLNHLM